MKRDIIRYFFIILVIAMGTPMAGYGQITDVTKTDVGAVSSLLKRSGAKKFSLLDPSKISMSHQYSMLFASGSGRRGATGLYLNTISYRFSPSMLLQVHIGMEHALTSSSQFRTGQGGKSRIVPGFDFSYRPTENTFIHVRYGTARSRYLDDHYLATDPYWIEGISTTSPFPHDPGNWRLNVSP